MAKGRRLTLTAAQWDAVTERANALLDEKRSHGLTAATDDGRMTMAAVGAAIQAYLDLLANPEAPS